MEYNNKEILFIGHEAARSGAPISLLRIIRWFSINTNYKIYILLNEGGELLSDYQKYGEVYVCKYGNALNKAPQTTYKRLIWKIHNKINQKYKKINFLLKQELFLEYRKKNINLIFCNTSANGNLLQALEFIKVPVIARIAELQFTIKHTFQDSFKLYPSKVHHFIAVSKKVKEDLILNFGIEAHKISVIYGAIDLHTTIKSVNLRKELGIPENTLLIGASGKGYHIKGADLILNIAQFVCNNLNKKNIHFVWFGGDSNLEYKKLMNDLEKMNLSRNIHFFEQKPDILPYFSAIDVFFLSSRHDPFPLVALEAAYFAKPILCFEKAGGIPEFVENDAGFIIPYLDLKNAADRIVQLDNNPELRKKLGECAKQKVLTKYHYNQIGLQYKKLFEKLI